MLCQQGRELNDQRWDAVHVQSLFSANEGLLFEVRPPQRRFKWKKQNVEQLCRDIVKAYGNSSDSAPYFLGPLLLVDLGNGAVSVIDGQQRITTMSILLAVLRDYCKEYGLSERASGIQRLLNRVDNDGKPVGTMVVTLQEQDRQNFVDLVKQEGSTKVADLPPGLLSDACKILREGVKEHINVPDPQETLRQLCEFVQTKVMFLPLVVHDEGEGYLVFDTSNTRGLRLSPSEALKARLAVVARENGDLADELIQKWNTAATKLENVNLPIDAMDDYLRSIWSSRRGHIPKRSLDRIAAEVNSTDDLRKIIEDLATYIDSFLAVVVPTRRAGLSEDLKDLRNLNNQSVVFLTMAHKHSPKRFAEAVDLVLSLQIRNITFGTDSPNAYERSWPNWARLVRNGEVDRAFDEMQARIRGDDEFRAAFEIATAVSTATVRHVLRRLDPISRPGSGVQPMEVDVEHVMPKSVVSKLTEDKRLTPSVRQWIEDLGYEIPETPEDKKEMGHKFGQWLNMLGNQALLNEKANRGLRDRPFADKKIFYGRQALKLTEELASNEQWGESQILERQKRMAKEAPSIWRK